MNHLLHPELVQTIPVFGDRAANALNQRVAETLASDPAQNPNITVAIRTYDEGRKLELLLRDIGQQVVGSEVEIILVDNESTDDTAGIAKAYGAQVVTLPRDEFTYPRSMNLGMQAASHNTVFLTVAHALLSSTHTLHAGARHFRPGSNVAGAFSVVLPSPDASRTSRWIDAGGALELFRGPQRIRRAGMGVMAATGAIFSKAAWQELGRFDERYKSGGEDTAMARAMLATGYTIVEEPGMAVHHSHKLGLLETGRELLHYAKTARGPQPMQPDLLSRRQQRLNGNK